MELNLEDKVLRYSFFEAISNVINKEVKLTHDINNNNNNKYSINNIIEKNYTFGNRYFGLYSKQLDILQFLIFVNEYKDILINFLKHNRTPYYREFNFLIKKILTVITYSQSVELHTNNEFEEWKNILLFDTIRLRDYLDDNIIKLDNYITENKLRPREYTRIVTRSVVKSIH
jgi:hypothetical protein